MLILEIKNRRELVCNDFTYGLLMEKNNFMGYYKIIPFVGVEVFTNCRICYTRVKEIISEIYNSEYDNNEWKLSNFSSLDEKYNNFKNITSKLRNEFIGNYYTKDGFSYTLYSDNRNEYDELKENDGVFIKITRMLNIDSEFSKRIIYNFSVNSRIKPLLDSILTYSSNGDLKYADYPIKEYQEDYEEIRDFDYQVSNIISKYLNNNDYIKILEITNTDGITHITSMHKDAILDTYRHSLNIIYRHTIQKFKNIMNINIYDFEDWIKDIDNRREEFHKIKKGQEKFLTFI